MAYRSSHENPEDEEIDGNSLEGPSVRSLAMYSDHDEGPVQMRYMSLPSHMFGATESHQQYEFPKASGPPKDPWGPLPSAHQQSHPRGLAFSTMSGSSQPSEQKANLVPSLFGKAHHAEESEEGVVCAERFPSTYRLERTNFVVTSTRYSGEDVELVVTALKIAFGLAAVDVVEFRPSVCTFKCSYQKRNLFLSFMVTVFLAPSQASGQLVDSYDEDGLILVEVQLLEGDGLYFSGLFRDLVDLVNNQEGITIAGTLRYRPCATHPYGEGLALESFAMKPPGPGPAPGKPMMGGGYPGSSPGEPSFDGDENPEELDQDMTEDVMLLSGMIREGFPTVQADAASVVAGLTSADSFRQQLSMDGASSAASALASASARLLVETPHRAARRQASVVVANLAYDPVLRAALLASDRSSSPSKGGSPASSGAGVGGIPHAQAQAEAFSRGLLESLVLFAVGGVTRTTTTAAAQERARVAGRLGEEKAGAEEDEEQEEEIGMRRECMRALLGLSESEEARDTEAMKSLLLMSTEPSGQGATDGILKAQLAACQNVLKSHA